VIKFAVPAAFGTLVPKLVVPFLNVTFPACTFGPELATTAVSVTASPKLDGSGLKDTFSPRLQVPFCKNFF